MPLLLAAFWGSLGSVLSSLLGRILVGLFLSYVTYSGFDFALGWAKDQIKSNLGGLPAEIVSLLAWLWVDRALSMIFSAVAASLVIRGITNGSITKMVVKK
jgi:hypothetical protein